MTEQSFIRDIIKLPAILARTMDNNDGKKDDQISGSVWNEYIAGNIQGTKIDEKKSISFSDAKTILMSFIRKISDDVYRNLLNTFNIGAVDQDGNIINYDENGKISLKEKYDDNGNIMVRAFYNDQGQAEKQLQYDEEGHLTMVASYTEGKLDRVKEYDIKGLPARNTKYNEDGSIHYFDLYNYDSRGKLSEVKRKNTDGITTDYYTYYENGKKLSHAQYDPESGALVSTTYYDENGKPKNTTGYNEDGTVDSRTKYNPDGSYSTVYYNDNETVTFTEEKDKNGNITRKYYTEDRKKIYKTEVYDSKTELWTITKYDNRGSIISKETAPMCLDGIVGDSAQKSQGDCYLMASINAIRQSAGGQEYLNSLIKKDGDNFVVTLPGAKIAANSFLADGIPQDKMYITGVYTFTPEELKEISEKRETGYSIGDDDTILIEVAFERFRKEAKQTMKENNIKKNIYNAGQYIGENTDNILRGGYEWDTIFVLTGEKSELYISSSFPKTDYNGFSYSKDNSPVNSNPPSFRGGDKPEGNITADDIDTDISDRDEIKSKTRKRRKLKKLLKKLKNDRKTNTNKYIATCGFQSAKGNGHGFTIKTVTDESVILINPWYPDKVTKIPIDEFMEKVYTVTVTEMPAKTT